jgi:RNA polymerase sigma factor (sigma-70 family)
VEAVEGFEQFFQTAEPRLRQAFTALYGPDVAVDAAAEALAWAFEHWRKVQGFEHPIAYLYRVGQSRTRRLRRRSWVPPTEGVVTQPDVDPGLEPALAQLAGRQRVCVMLVHGYGWSHDEVASTLGIGSSTVATHVARAIEKLRAQLEVYEHD